jgi:flavin reductase (DIM6/NTAB) family NADH-FMN oxidoreductase RutF
MTMQNAAVSELGTYAEEDGTVDKRAFRNALGRYPTGVAIVTTLTKEGEKVGLTINSFSSVSLDPPLVLWSLVLTARCRDWFSNSGRFAVNVLAAGQINLSQRFAGSWDGRFDGLQTVEAAVTKSPLLSGVAAWFDCTIEREIEAGDHLIYVGQVRWFDQRDHPPLLYDRGRYAISADHPGLT